jgi:small subunit ribosomal protein S27e
VPRKRKLYKKLTPESRSRFVKVRCPTCGNEQVVFSHATYPTSCVMCGTKLVESTGGKAKILGEIVKIFE